MVSPEIPNPGNQNYEIRGPSRNGRVVRFDTTEAAAKDGIALSFEIARMTGDSLERGAAIDKLSNGGYIYRSLEIGSTAKRDFKLGSETIIRGTPLIRFNTTTSTAAIFHIHPGASNLPRENADFSPGDVEVYEDQLLPRGRVSYLGGNDGSFDVMRPRVDTRTGKSAGYETITLQPKGYFKVPTTKRLPTDMRGEPR